MIRRPLSIIVLIDALGWEMIRDCAFLDGELPHRQPLETVLGFSSGAIPTLLTGRLPQEHGHWNLYYADPKHSPFRFLRPLRHVPGPLVENRLVRKAIKEAGRRVLGMGPLFECCVSPRLLHHFNWIERRSIYGAGGVPGTETIFDTCERAGVNYRVYSYHQGSDAELLRRAHADVAGSAASFLFVYLSEVDAFLHMHCADREQVRERLRWYEAQLRSLLRLGLQADPELRFAVTSDHGMTPVTNRFDLTGWVDALRLRMPQQYMAVYDSTMARFWYFDEKARQTIRAALVETPCGRFLDADELRDLGIYFADGRYGEDIFLLHPGWLIAKSDFNGRGWNPHGMHGYHPSDSFSDAILLSRHAPEAPMRHIRDLHAHMLQSCGLGRRQAAAREA